MKKIVIIGGVAAGTTAAARLKRLKPDFDITLLEKSDVISYGTCELPYVIDETIPGFDDIVFFTDESFQQQKGVEVKLNSLVTEINPKTKTVVYHHGIYKSTHKIQYDKLLIATGASPKTIPFLDAVNSFSVKSLDSAKRLKRYLNSEKPQHAVIIGAGLIGLELAESLTNLGIRVSLVDTENQVLFGKIDLADSKIVEQILEKSKVQFYKSEKIKSAIKNGFSKIEKLVFESGLELFPDIAIQTIGFQPNTSFKGLEEIKKTSHGAILVNSKMETSAKDIYAAGDCAAISRSGKENEWFPLATVASKMGRVAATSMAGLNEQYGKSFGTFAVKLFDFEVAHSGMTLVETINKKIDAKESRIKGSSRVSVYPNSQEISVQIVYELKTGKILGGTIIGKEGAALRINMISLALQNEMTVSDLRNSDFMYTPPFSPLWDPVLIAANQAKT